MYPRWGAFVVVYVLPPDGHDEILYELLTRCLVEIDPSGKGSFMEVCVRLSVLIHAMYSHS